VKLSNFNAYRTESFGKFLPNEFRIFNFFLIFFQIFMIRFGPIELAIYPNEAFDSIDKKSLIK
jgi:hypothetical protein